MGALMRTIDWAATPLGPVEGWPQSLRTALGILLLTRHPAFIWWGPDLIQFYNDGYRPILGATKHPAAMGGRGRETWAEIWHVIEPMIERVLGGGSTYERDGLLVLDRNGFPEECYFDYAYSPIRDESGGVGGIFVACSETTRRVVGRAAAAGARLDRLSNRGRRQRRGGGTGGRGGARRGVRRRPLRRHLPRARRRADPLRFDRRARGFVRPAAHPPLRPAARPHALPRAGGRRARRARVLGQPGAPARARRPDPGRPPRRPVAAPPLRRQVPRLPRARGRARGAGALGRGCPRGGAPPGARAGRARPSQDHLLLQREPRAAHAAHAHARPHRGRAGLARGSPAG